VDGDTARVGFSEAHRRSLDGEFDDASEEDKDRGANELARAAEVAVSVVTLQPLPFLDPAFVTPIQVGLVRGLGRIRGYVLDRPDALELLGRFGITLVTQHCVIAAAKFVPTLGTIASVSIAYSLTHAAGEVCDDYFRGGCTMSPVEMHAAFERLYRKTLQTTYREKWGEFRAMLRRRFSSG
jgi:uncharacterized protein (DUF697 family)